MPVTHSPLRYPGGKTALAPFLAGVVHANTLQGGVYAEPYAGGAGAALELLFGEHVDSIWINDADFRIYAFWVSILDHTKRFLDMLRKVPVGVKEWRVQRRTYLEPKRYSLLRVGFSTFFLNRCNRSGILLKAGPIGGRKQTGRWKIDARFNRAELCRKIERIAQYRDRIKVTHLDAIDFLRRKVEPCAQASRIFAYLDPPYYARGSELYLNHYGPDDHRALAEYMLQPHRFKWVISYDNVAEIRRLYRGVNQVPFNLNYSASRARVGNELLICNRSVRIPMADGCPVGLLSTA
ncbi:MAG: DNA adenine methylase [Armatimonadetes bacterium]|nr:DNA adenine methylase [Armatimonadota bacterium]